MPPWNYNDEVAKKPNKSMDEAVADLRTVLGNLPGSSIIESKSVKSEYGEGYYGTCFVPTHTLFPFLFCYMRVYVCMFLVCFFTD